MERFEHSVVFDPQNPYKGPNFGSHGRQNMRYGATAGGFKILINGLIAYKDKSNNASTYQLFRTKPE